MARRIWLPYPDAAAAQAALGPIPEGLAVDGFLADGTWPDSIGDVELLVAPYMFPAPKVMERVAEMTSLKAVQLLSAGYDNFLPFLPEGVQLCNAAGVHDASTAELAVALALASTRHLDLYARNMPTGSWRNDFTTSLADRHILIIGYGRIGAAIEQRLAGFEPGSITRVARRARTGDVPVHPIEELHSLLPKAEVVFVITPLTASTEHLIGAAELALLPDGALLVNVARGKVVDTDALVAATSSGRIRAALDVTDPEPLPSDHPLWRAPGVLISPHVGGQSSAFWPRMEKMVRGQLVRFAAGEPLLNVVA
ncbi:MAG TPA: 2-hydroxyacid dehydrogenase [Propionicimonas sp.]|uniref:2-hydroxyacid dehydrogenase n=1 Tax=Propionicimonas sp. TaxID=1955623 RepID=UPI002F4269D2